MSIHWLPSLQGTNKIAKGQDDLILFYEILYISVMFIIVSS